MVAIKVFLEAGENTSSLTSVHTKLRLSVDPSSSYQIGWRRRSVSRDLCRLSSYRVAYRIAGLPITSAIVFMIVRLRSTGIGIKPGSEGISLTQQGQESPWRPYKDETIHHDKARIKKEFAP
jgi:hypothetical protein